MAEIAEATGASLVAAVPRERWLELIETHPNEETVAFATQGLARLALFQNDWRVCEPLLERTGDGLLAGLHALSILGDEGALPALEKRLETATIDDAVAILRVLDTLGSGARQTLPPERIREIDARAFDSRVFELAREKRPAELVAQAAVSEAEARWKSLLDRTGGSSRDLELLSTVSEELHADDVEAWRRRDGEAVAQAISRLLGFDASEALPRDAHEVALRVRIASACAETIREAKPRKTEFDALGAAGFVHALVARARCVRGVRSAVVLALMGEVRVWETVREPGVEGARLVGMLAESDLPRAAEALVACALGWRLSGFAASVVESARSGGLLWGYVHARLSVRLEDELLDVLEEESDELDAFISLLSQFVSTRAEALVPPTIRGRELVTRLYLSLVVRAFPTERVLSALRTAPLLGAIELERRFELLAEFDPTLTRFDPKAPSLWCSDCGHVMNVAGALLVSVRQALVPEPPVTCLGCGAMGTQAGADPTKAERPLRLQPAFEADETPRQALDRFARDPVTHALDIVETLLLCGEEAAALDAFQLVVPADRIFEAPRMVTLLLRLGDAKSAKDVVEKALGHPEAWAMWNAEEVDGLKSQLAAACGALGVPVPDIEPSAPTLALDDVSIPSRKVGRNESCPCGSGRKYKKCHGP